MFKGGYSNLFLQWMEYMVCLFFFQEISMYWVEIIYQYIWFQVYIIMYSIWFFIQIVVG